MSLLIFLARRGVPFLNLVKSRTATPEAALQQHLGRDEAYQVIAKRKLLDNSENQIVIVFCSGEPKQMKACMEGKIVSCILVAQRLGGWRSLRMVVIPFRKMAAVTDRAWRIYSYQVAVCLGRDPGIFRSTCGSCCY
jgi:hypothetical protein